jgi:hypothetical protein
VNLRSGGVIPVVLFGSESFDVRTVVPDSLSFGPGGAYIVHDKKGPHFEYVNDDDLLDLVSHYRVGDAELEDADGSACLVGATEDGGAFAGCDDVTLLGR